jgi:queuine tRNA-ribosyltransferase
MSFEPFELLAEKNGVRQGVIHTMHGDIYTSAFGPDATRGTIKNVDPQDLKKIDPNDNSQTQQKRWQNFETQFVLTNTYHQLSYPGPEFIKEMGGLHKLMQWDRPILTDSGGFQVFSLIHAKKNKRNKKGQLKAFVDEEGAQFVHPYTGQRFKLTPEKAIDIQFAFGSDIMVALDDCRHFEDEENMEASVERTIRWARQCKLRFEQNLQDQYGLTPGQGPRPLLFAVIQGGFSKELREYCTKELNKIGFDGFGFGGWAVNTADAKDSLPYDLMEFTANLIPKNKPRYAMGVGTPTDIKQLIPRGYDLFDCVIPSRNARHGLVYTSQGDIKITNAKFKQDTSPLDPKLNSPAAKYPKFFLHHLFKTKDPLGGNLLTLHNLKFFNYLMTSPDSTSL